MDNNETITVHANRSKTVDRNETVRIGMNKTETILMASLQNVGMGRMENVGARLQPERRHDDEHRGRAEPEHPGDEEEDLVGGRHSYGVSVGGSDVMARRSPWTVRASPSAASAHRADRRPRDPPALRSQSTIRLTPGEIEILSPNVDINC
ncbi:bacteriophage T4 gp5 trimerization domain-containing protein [Pseudomonas aeruginosa]